MRKGEWRWLKNIRKSIIVSNLLSLFLLGYYAVTKGLDWIIGTALIISVISNILNIVYEVSDGREKG